MSDRQFTKYLIYCGILSVAILSVCFNLSYYRTTNNFRSLILPDLRANLKSILVWNSPTKDPIKNLGVGQTSFLSRNCSVINCFVSSNRQLFQDLTEYDVVVFHGPELTDNWSDLPQSRSPQQKYVFASMESSNYYPSCNLMYNSFFNWTWTYKLKSDKYYGYIIVRNKEGKLIGPKVDMHWKKVEAMEPIDDILRAKLSTKKIAAAWFVSNCHTHSKREIFVKQLQSELAKYNMTVDIIGECGTRKCPRKKMEKCLRVLEREYFFYLSFENSFSEDYVTEKLLHALQHNTVPIVYGGANYTRFMPDGIYLNARKQPKRELAKQIFDIINDKQKYYSFFKWQNYYTYHDQNESPETDAYCKLCAMINDDQCIKKTSVYNSFMKWWNPPDICYTEDLL